MDSSKLRITSSVFPFLILLFVLGFHEWSPFRYQSLIILKDTMIRSGTRPSDTCKSTDACVLNIYLFIFIIRKI